MGKINGGRKAERGGKFGTAVDTLWVREPRKNHRPWLGIQLIFGGYLPAAMAREIWRKLGQENFPGDYDTEMFF